MSDRIPAPKPRDNHEYAVVTPSRSVIPMTSLDEALFWVKRYEDHTIVHRPLLEWSPMGRVWGYTLTGADTQALIGPSREQAERAVATAHERGFPRAAVYFYDPGDEYWTKAEN